MAGYLVIVLDASERAEWPAAVRLAADVIAALPETSVLGVHVLGSSLRWDADDWSADLPWPAMIVPQLPLISPVAGALKGRSQQPQGVVLIGSGYPLDFDDWADRFVWARVGSLPDSPDRRITVFDQVDPSGLANWCRDARRQLRPTRHMPDGFERGRWRLDPMGFPMVWVDPLRAYWQLWPMTKPQVEHWLVHARQPGFDGAWYAELLRKNPRLSPAARSLTATERLFVTNLWPSEVESIAEWCGPDFRIPKVAEWQTAFRWLAAEEVSIPPFSLERDLAPVALRLWTTLLDEQRPQTLLGLSLMRSAIVEWTIGADGGWVGMGQPRTEFHQHFHDALTETWPPSAPDRRSRLFGMRLLATG